MMKSSSRLPVRTCLINSDWDHRRVATIILARGHPNGRIAAAAFMADLGCLGIKHAVGKPDLTEGEFAKMLARFPTQDLIECSPAFAARLLNGAWQYAKSLGFKPDPEFFGARELFGDITGDGSESDEEIEFGQGGKPLYVAGPFDNVGAIMNQLTKKLGEGGFHYAVPESLDGLGLNDPDDLGP